MRHDNFIPNVKIRSRGRLPHWEADNAIYSVTFRLADSLPQHIARSLWLERERMLRTVTTDAERVRFDEAFSLRLDHYLDEGHGSCLLRQHGALVAEALRHFDGERYQLHAWCVMPNHVHVMFYLEFGRDLEKVVHSWKSYTSHEIDLGNVWQKEYFDRVIRSPEHFNATRAYIRNNPVKAGLQNWPWVG